jgi:hypothetical protein
VRSGVLYEVNCYSCVSHLESSSVHQTVITKCTKFIMMAFSGISFMLSFRQTFQGAMKAPVGPVPGIVNEFD